MSSEWRQTTLGEFCAFSYGKALPERNRKTGTVPVISSAGIVGYHNEALVQTSGIVIGRKGTVGSITLSEKPFWAIDTAFFIVDQPQKRALRFTYYLLKMLNLPKMNTDSAVPGLNRENAHALPVNIPPLHLQIEISTILGALDDRITLLRETNATLEAIAQALFKSWFIDFKPVRAKAEGCIPEGIDAETAALFPSSFVENELGLVPKGWDRISFIETVEVIGGGTPKTSKSEYWNGNIPWFSVIDAPTKTDLFVMDTEKHITELAVKNSSTKILPEGTTIISARGTVGRLALVGREMAMNQSCYGLRGKVNDTYFTYFNTYHLVEILKQYGHGSVFNTITRDTFASVSVIYPSKVIINKFEEVLCPLMKRIKNNNEQISTFSNLRDILLPRLISGKLRLDSVGGLG